VSSQILSGAGAGDGTVQGQRYQPACAIPLRSQILCGAGAGAGTGAAVPAWMLPLSIY
jgi:hypothetical protein